MKIAFFLSILTNFFSSINTYALDNCTLDHTPTCEIIKQLQDLNSKIDDTNQQLNNIESKFEEIKFTINSNDKFN